jgi:hypothetical protein
MEVAAVAVVEANAEEALVAEEEAVRGARRRHRAQ